MARPMPDFKQWPYVSFYLRWKMTLHRLFVFFVWNEFKSIFPIWVQIAYKGFFRSLLQYVGQPNQAKLPQQSIPNRSKAERSLKRKQLLFCLLIQKKYSKHTYRNGHWFLNFFMADQLNISIFIVMNLWWGGKNKHVFRFHYAKFHTNNI